MRGREDRGMLARPQDIFLSPALTKGCMRVSGVTTSEAEGKQKLRATVDSVWQKKAQNHGVSV